MIVKYLQRLSFLRRVTRKLGLNRFIFNFFYDGNSYEEHFDKSFNDLLFPDYCVYDIGANIGHYTKVFSEKVGKSGVVIAFEPSKINFDKLIHNISNYSNVEAINIAVGAEETVLILSQGEDEIGATSSIISDTNGVGQITNVLPLDKIVVGRPFPNAIKIDVEGFELEVLNGALNTLNDNRLKLLGIEVHFSLLEAKNVKNVTGSIESILKTAGFTIKWTDFSHIIATK